MSINDDLSPDAVAKLQNALEDEAFVNSLYSMQTVEEIQIALKEKDVDLTIDEIKSIGEAVKAADNEGEISESELEDVSGGNIGTGLAKIIARWLEDKIRGRPRWGR